MTKALQEMQGIQSEDVPSLYTADNIVGAKDELDVKAFYKRSPKDEKGLDALKLQVRKQ